MHFYQHLSLLCRQLWSEPEDQTYRLLFRGGHVRWWVWIHVGWGQGLIWRDPGQGLLWGQNRQKQAHGPPGEWNKPECFACWMVSISSSFISTILLRIVTKLFFYIIFIIKAWQINCVLLNQILIWCCLYHSNRLNMSAWSIWPQNLSNLKEILANKKTLFLFVIHDSFLWY